MTKRAGEDMSDTLHELATALGDIAERKDIKQLLETVWNIHEWECTELEAKFHEARDRRKALENATRGDCKYCVHIKPWKTFQSFGACSYLSERKIGKVNRFGLALCSHWQFDDARFAKGGGDEC